ncbi:hypothetical protein ACIPZ8_14630 [Pseudomonas sp. NPDC089422]|uniref:hypothetical protein n=1 Tax=Pseudomonas sp. NPDC089422 TaxID=3364466 RepID=UPI0038297D36
MKFEDVTEVIQARTTTAANQLLGKGWTLLAVVAGESGPDYVLGRAKGSEPLPGLERVKAPAINPGALR